MAAAEVAAAISTVVAEEMPRTIDELASVAGKAGGTGRGRTLTSQLIAAALDQTAEVRFCIINDEFCIKIDEFCITNDESCNINDEFCI